MKTTSITRILAVLALLVPALLLPTTLPAAQAHPHPYCGIWWGSLPKSSSAVVNPTSDPGYVVDVRSGRHACYDRLVIDVDGASDGYYVRYVSQVRQDGSGFVVPTDGGARLSVIARQGAYHWPTATPTYDPADPSELVDVDGYRTFRQVTWAGSFESQSTVGLGVRARLPFRVFTLAGPGDGSRIVVDVAHRW